MPEQNSEPLILSRGEVVVFDFITGEVRVERVNEHGNVIDYGPQFGEDDDT